MAAEYFGIGRIVCAIGFDRIATEQINVPDDLCSGGKVIGAFSSHRTFSFWPIIIFASDFDSKDWRAFEKAHACGTADVKRGIRAERFAVRQLDAIADVIRISASW